MTKPREKETGLQGLRWSLVMSPNEYFYIGFWILVSGNTKGNWELKKKRRPQASLLETASVLPGDIHDGAAGKLDVFALQNVIRLADADLLLTHLGGHDGTGGRLGGGSEQQRHMLPAHSRASAPRTRSGRPPAPPRPSEETADGPGTFRTGTPERPPPAQYR